MVVQERDQRAHAASSCPPNSAAIAKAKATEKPTYPIYSIGGWKIMPGSCSKGFRSRPSRAAGIKRSKGLDTMSINSKKPTLIKPMTPKILARMSSGRCFENKLTATVQMLSIIAHNNNEPSWPPQTAAIRNWMGSFEFELVATYATE